MIQQTMFTKFYQSQILGQNHCCCKSNKVLDQPNINVMKL